MLGGSLACFGTVWLSFLDTFRPLDFGISKSQKPPKARSQKHPSGFWGHSGFGHLKTSSPKVP